jgi:hypothetical protein
VASPVTAGEKTLVVLNVSQSNGASSVGTGTYTVLNPTKVLELNPYSGTAYQLVEPTLGATVTPTRGSLIGKLGDLCVTGGFDKFICCSIAIGGTPIAAWKSSGVLHHRLLAGLRRMNALIMSAPAGSTICPAIMTMIGETDANLGTSQASWEASFRDAQAAVAGQGLSYPWFVAKCSYVSGATNTTIQAAQVAVVDNVSIFAGADVNSITDRLDGTHLNNTGRDAAAALWKTVFANFYP